MVAKERDLSMRLKKGLAITIGASLGVLLLASLPFLLVYIPLIAVPNRSLNDLADLFVFLALASSWHWYNGQMRCIDLGHTVFWGIGAYCTAIAMTQLAAFPLAVLVGVICASLYAGFIGLIILRFQRAYFSIATLAILFATRLLVSASKAITGGGTGLTLNMDYDLRTYYYSSLMLLLFIISVSTILNRTRLRIILTAISHDETLAMVRGIPVLRYKLATYVLSALWTSLAGSIYLYRHSVIIPDTVFSELQSFQVVFANILGGTQVIVGPLIGGLLDYGLLARYPPTWHFISSSILLMLVLLYLPNGITALWHKAPSRQRGNNLNLADSETRDGSSWLTKIF